MTTSTLSDLLQGVRSTGIELATTPNDEIRVVGPRLQPIDRAALKAHRPAVLAVLKLEQRLQNGWDRCNGEVAPAERERLEDHWITLLQELESLLDQPVEGVVKGRVA